MDQDTVTVGRFEELRDSNSVSAAVIERPLPDLLREAGDLLRHDEPCFVSRAPGRMNFLGGLADYAGGDVLNMPLAESVWIAVQRRPGNRVCVAALSSVENNGRPFLEFDLQELYRARESQTHSTGRNALFAKTSCRTVRCVIAALVEMLDRGLACDLGEGLTIAVGSTLNDVSDCGCTAATVASLVTAVSAALGLEPNAQTILEVYRHIENRWLNRPANTADAACACFGEPGALNQFQTGDDPVPASIPLPDDLRLVGIDLGIRQQDRGDKNMRVRNATLMGWTLVDRIMRHEGLNDRRWTGRLAQLSISDYVERIRDRIPTKMRGSDYLSRYGEPNDPWAVIDASAMYKIRSRVEHHVYEQARCQEFVECLARYAKKADQASLVEVREVMYSSHWSYGQRCGLGCVQTDALVSAIRAAGPSEDLVGAKITGRGCGGLLAVLMKSSDRARETLQGILHSLEEPMGLKARVLESGTAGVMISGVQTV